MSKASTLRTQRLLAADGSERLIDKPARRKGRGAFRGGYDAILDYFSGGAADRRFDLRLGRRVSSIRWRPRSVQLDVFNASGTDAETYKAQAAIVTLPLGVLQTVDERSAVHFVPDVPEKRRVWERLQMGSVVKLALLFREPFWRDLGNSDLVFLHTPLAAFVAWWTTLPTPSSMLTGWSGGPKAAQLSQLNPADILEIGLSILAESLQIRSAEFSKMLVRHRVFDWHADPFSCGAYAYVPVGGSGLPAEMAAPVSDTLFFAGEATHPQLAGTVEGAIATGARAAREVLAAIE